MSEELRKNDVFYNKYFNFKKSDLSLLNLMIIDEIKSQLEDEISDEDYNKLFYTIKNCYLKSDNIDLWCLTNYCIKNIDVIDNMDCWFIINHSSIM